MIYSFILFLSFIAHILADTEPISVNRSSITASVLESTMKLCEQNSSQCLPPLIPRKPLWLISEVHKMAMCRLPSVLSPLLDRTFCLLNLPYVAGRPDTSTLARQICALSPIYAFSMQNASHFIDWDALDLTTTQRNEKEMTRGTAMREGDGSGNPRLSKPSSSALFSQPSSRATQSKPAQDAVKSSPSDSARSSRPNSSSTFSKPSTSATNEKPSLSATGSEVSSAARYSKPSTQGLHSLPEVAAYRSDPSLESTRSLPFTPSSFSPPSNESVFSMPRGGFSKMSVSFSLPSPTSFYSKPTASVLFSSPSGSAYFARSSEENLREQPSKEILYSKNFNAMLEKPKLEAIISKPENESIQGKPGKENTFGSPKSASLISQPNLFSDAEIEEIEEKETTSPATVQTEWTFLAAVQEPFSRFLLNWWSQCVKPASLGEKSCFGCRENMTCLLDFLQEKAFLFLSGESAELEKDQVIGYFLPQNWQCDFARFPYHIIEYSIVGEVVSYVEKAIQSLLQPVTQRSSSTALLSNDPLREVKFEDFNKKLSELLDSPELLEAIIRLYYHDFVLFGFHGYFH